MASLREQRAVLRQMCGGNPDWRKKVNKMPDKQVQAIYLRLTPDEFEKYSKPAHWELNGIEIYHPQ